MKKALLFSLILTLVACQDTRTFTVRGHVSNAEGKTLYLEHTALLQTTCLDSCTLDAEGSFSFQHPSPKYPDLYRLRIDSKSLPLIIDSTEQITINTPIDSIAITQSIQGSESSRQIAEFRAKARHCSTEELRKEAQQLIVANPRSMVAYYAVFMKKKGEFIWKIDNPSDRRMYQAVATSFHQWMPDYERTKALCTQVKSVMHAERKEKQQTAMRQLIDEAENAFLDIQLPDAQDNTKSLSDLIGNVVILDFSAIEMEQSKGYIFELREIYNKYHSLGMEIYSVSLDRNKLLWEDGVTHLPWINIYAGEHSGEVLTRYNVQSLPTLFLLDRNGNVQGRYIDFEQLDADIQKYL